MNKQYTVIVLMPDYLRDSGETNIYWVIASTPKDAELEAIAAIRKEMEMDHDDDAVIVATYEGYLNNLSSMTYHVPYEREEKDPQ